MNVRHVHSHVLIHECEDPFEEWAATWNAKADAAAGVANLNRSLQFTDILAAAKLHVNKYARLSRELRALCFSIAQTNLQAPHPDEDELEITFGGDVQQRARDDIIADYIPSTGSCTSGEFLSEGFLHVSLHPHWNGF